jgi:hypothetical protein
MNKNLQRILLAFTVISLFGSSALAQGTAVEAKGEVHNATGDIPKPVDNTVNKQDYEGWKYPVDAVLTVGSSINR